MATTQILPERLAELAGRETLPLAEEFMTLQKKAAAALVSPDSVTRPPNAKGGPGGLVYADPSLPAIIVPDLHARRDFFHSILMMTSPFSPLTVLEAVAEGVLSLVFVGDAFHSERQGRDRWLAAQNDYLAGNPAGEAMTAEMADNLGLMEMLMELLSAFPSRVIYLKGNHENVLNEEGNGNHPFRKFADEGEMTRDFLLERYGVDLLLSHAEFERLLPLAACGGRFLVSHAEPLLPFSRSDIIDCSLKSEVVEGLTWTGNSQSREGSVSAMLDSLLPGLADTVYFGGHRIVSGGYALRANGRFIQIHDPVARTVAFVGADRPFSIHSDLRSVP